MMLKTCDAETPVLKTKNLPSNMPVSSHRMLTIGPMKNLNKLRNLLSPEEEIAIAYGKLNAATLALHRPDIVVSPLLCDEFDILDIATRLVAVGYGGALIALTPPLPNVDAIAKEIRSQFRALEIFLIVETS
jgi:hypothetical protein